MPIEYELDPRGALATHRVTETVDVPTGKKIRAIAPSKGVFFTNTVKVVQKDTARVLVPNTDYVFTEGYETLSLRYSQPIAGVILITNADLAGPFEITYQILGGVYTDPIPEVATYINSKSQQILATPIWLKVHTPRYFIPPSSWRVLSTKDYTFEYIVYALERMRLAILKADDAGWGYSMELLKDYASRLMQYMNQELEPSAKVFIEQLKNSLDASKAGLSKLKNYLLATQGDGAKYANTSYVYTQQDARYIATKALLGFKEAIYDLYISTQKTGIDRPLGVTALPTLRTLTNMTNGTRYVFDSIDNAKAAKLYYDTQAYPTETDPDSKWVIYKLTNNEKDSGGIFLAFNMKTAAVYTGELTISQTQNTSMRWLRQMTQKDASEYIEKLHKHITDENNPHATKKFHVGLGEVENLPVVTQEEILCRRPLKAYVTHDAMKFFWMNYMKEVKPVGEDDDDEAKVKAAERLKMIFAPCGPCGTVPAAAQNRTKPTVTHIEPRDKLLAVYCRKNDKMGRYSDGFGRSYEKLVEKDSVDCHYKRPIDTKERGALIATYCDGTSLYGKYSDGKCGYYTGLIGENHANCRGTNTQRYIEVRNSKGVIVGMGYAASYTQRDSDASVALANKQGLVLCYMFPAPKAVTIDQQVANVELRDDDGQTLGYLMRVN